MSTPSIRPGTHEERRPRSFIASVPDGRAPTAPDGRTGSGDRDESAADSVEFGPPAVRIADFADLDTVS